MSKIIIGGNAFEVQGSLSMINGNGTMVQVKKLT